MITSTLAAQSCLGFQTRVTQPVQIGARVCGATGTLHPLGANVAWASRVRFELAPQGADIHRSMCVSCSYLTPTPRAALTMCQHLARVHKLGCGASHIRSA